MNPAFLGDSYDLVKRFFVEQLHALKYEVAVDPLFTGEWGGEEEVFHRLLGATHRDARQAAVGRRALFLDPDTGVREQATRRHVSFNQLAAEANQFDLVFTFDQSFSRQCNPATAMTTKLQALSDRGLTSLYYDSHARFLFTSRAPSAITELAKQLDQTGIPARRLIRSAV